MKLSEALAADMEILQMESVGLEHCGYRGDLNNRPALIAWLKNNPQHDGKIRKIAVPVGQKTLRPEQPEFERAVWRAYGGKCAITAETAKPALEAAHLPGRKHQLGHNAASDGILLRADLHKLMDAKPPMLFLVRENNDIVVRIHPDAGPNYRKLNGEKIRIPKRIFDRPAI